MTSNAITTKSTSSDSSEVLAIGNLSQTRRMHTIYLVVMLLLTLVSEGRESKVNGIQPEDDDLEDDDEEEFEDTDDSLCVFFFIWPDTRLIDKRPFSLRGKQELGTSGHTNKSDIRPSNTGDASGQKKPEEGNNGGN